MIFMETGKEVPLSKSQVIFLLIKMILQYILIISLS